MCRYDTAGGCANRRKCPKSASWVHVRNSDALPAVTASLALAGLVGLILALPGTAAASGVSPVAKKVAGVWVSVSSCGSLAGIGVAWTVTVNVVTSVVLTSIPTACIGGSLSMTLIDATNT